MLSTLITSKSRIEVLTWFLTHPGERFHYVQLTGLLRSAKRSIQIELKRLEGGGILRSEKIANARFYWVDQDHPLYPALKEIVFKTVGLADFLRESLEEIGDIHAAFIYGSGAKNLEEARSDIDVMVVGDVDADELHKATSKAEDALGREVNYTVFDLADWRKPLAAKKAFVRAVAEGPKIFLVGGEDALR